MKKKIDEEFTHNGIKYIVKEADISYPYKCVRCGFFDHIDMKCRGTLSVTGDCRRRWRKDGKEVIFVKL